MRGEVQFDRGRWQVDERANSTSLVGQPRFSRRWVPFLESSYRDDRSGEVLDLVARTKRYGPFYERFSDGA